MNFSFYNFPIFAAGEDVSPLSGPPQKAAADFLVIWQEEGGGSGDSRVFLEKILKAADKDPQSNTLLLRITPGTRVGLADLCRKWTISRVLIFGIEPEYLGMSLRPPLYQPFILGERAYLWADELALIQKERAEGKTKRSKPLWVGIQQLLK